jgi:hypothetical protein
VDREFDSRFAGKLAQAPGEGQVHPESIAEVDLARVIAALE